MSSTTIARVGAISQSASPTVEELELAAGYARAEKSEATQKAYWKDFAHFADRGSNKAQP